VAKVSSKKPSPPAKKAAPASRPPARPARSAAGSARAAIAAKPAKSKPMARVVASTAAASAGKSRIAPSTKPAVRDARDTRVLAAAAAARPRVKDNQPRAGSDGPQRLPGRPERAEVRNNMGSVRPETLASVPTNLAPRKNQAGLSSRELETFRDLLLAKRREILGDLTSMEREALRTSGGTNLSTLPLHMADMGTDNYEQEFTLGLVEKDRQLIREINAALAKIQNGSYGLCEATGKPIGKPRLEAQPWARYSIEHARKLERNHSR
jgi:RNA polymerase-binding protein DksA